MRMTTLFAAVAALAASPAWAQETPDLEHFDTIEKAVESTKKSKKEILVDFTGSDWCGWCIKLDEEVFSQTDWKKEASGKYVFVTLDFPHNKKLPAEQKAYNDRAQRLYGIQGFPTIMVFDHEGRPYARTGYQQGGPAGYLEHLTKLGDQRKEIADLRAKAGANAKDVDAREAVLQKVESLEVAAGYLDVKEELVALGSPKKQEYAKDLALGFHARGDMAKHKQYLEALRKMDAGAAEGVETSIWVEAEVMPLIQNKDFKGALEKLTPAIEKAKGESGQQLVYFAALCEFRLGNHDKTLELLEKALGLAPESKMAAEIKGAIGAVKKKAGK
jgi:thioredoxin-related protein